MFSGFRSAAVLAAVSVFAWVGAAGAATTVSATGVSGLLVGSQVYNVSFQQGSCLDVFEDCDDAGEFDFADSASARAAAEALADYLTVNDYFWPYYIPTGCSISCFIRIPFAVDITPDPVFPDFPFIDVLFWEIADTGGFENWFVGDDRDEYYSDPFDRLYARFTLVSEVPLPASVLLLAGGLAGLGALRRRGA